MNEIKKRWSRRYDECIICKTTKSKYHSNGMCRSCYRKKWQKENPEKVKKYFKKYREENIEKIKELGRKYREKNPEKVKEDNKKYREKNAKKEKERIKKYRKENPEKIKKSLKLWKKNNPKKIKEYARIYLFNKRNNNLHFKLKCNISRSVNHRLKSRLSSKNKKSTWDFLPYTVSELKQHLESLFVEGMSWKNYGYLGWHIDHKTPDRKFNYKNVEDEEFQK